MPCRYFCFVPTSSCAHASIDVDGQGQLEDAIGLLESAQKLSPGPYPDASEQSDADAIASNLIAFRDELKRRHEQQQEQRRQAEAEAKLIADRAKAADDNATDPSDEVDTGLRNRRRAESPASSQPAKPDASITVGDNSTVRQPVAFSLRHLRFLTDVLTAARCSAFARRLFDTPFSPIGPSVHSRMSYTPYS